MNHDLIERYIYAATRQLPRKQRDDVAQELRGLIEPQGWLAAMTGWLAMVCNSLLAAFTIITILFAFFYHKGVRITEPFNFDDLPPVPKRTQEISRWE